MQLGTRRSVYDTGQCLQIHSARAYWYRLFWRGLQASGSLIQHYELSTLTSAHPIATWSNYLPCQTSTLSFPVFIHTILNDNNNHNNKNCDLNRLSFSDAPAIALRTSSLHPDGPHILVRLPASMRIRHDCTMVAPMYILRMYSGATCIEIDFLFSRSRSPRTVH